MTDAASFKVKISTYSGTTRELPVECSNQITVIKDKLFELEGIQPDQQRLLYKGSVLADTATIESSNIQPNDVLHMVLNIRG
jgi:aspartate 1-decarboxylase